MAKTVKSQKDDLKDVSGDKKPLSDKKIKELENKKKKKEKKELDRIRSAVSFPFKALFQLSLILGMIYFIFKFFGQSATLTNALFQGFIAFSAVYLGIGALMVVVFFMISENKKREKRMKIEQDIERRHQEDEQRRIDEMRMAEEQSQIARQLREEQRKHEETLRQNSLNNQAQRERNSGLNNAEMVSPNESDFSNFTTDNNADNGFNEDLFIEKEMLK